MSGIPASRTPWRTLGLLLLLAAVVGAGAPGFALPRLHHGHPRHPTRGHAAHLHTAHRPTHGIPLDVQRSAARHRAQLAHRPEPGQAAVAGLIRRTARAHGLDPDLALAVAWNESGFQQGVVSPVDAVGVMQVLPSTARVLGWQIGRPLDLLRPADNVLAGVLLLRQLVGQTGRADLALAGYYQGLGSVASVGTLPQTYDYIRTVTALRARFRAART